MSHRWLLFLLCPSLPLLLTARLSRARGILRVNEAATRFSFRNENPQLLLAIENGTGAPFSAAIQIEAAISSYDILPDRVAFYLWPSAGGVKFDFKFRPRSGLKAKTAASSIYDYYNPEARAVVAPAHFVVR